jgi:hypothetical protein
MGETAVLGAGLVWDFFSEGLVGVVGDCFVLCTGILEGDVEAAFFVAAIWSATN